MCYTKEVSGKKSYVTKKCVTPESCKEEPWCKGKWCKKCCHGSYCNKGQDMAEAGILLLCNFAVFYQYLSVFSISFFTLKF